MKIEVILAAVDFSQVSEAVYAWAERLAVPLGAKVVLLNVTEPEVDYVGMYPPQAFSTADEVIRRGAEAALRVARERLEQASVVVETVHRMGPLVPTILAEVQRVGADLVVIGSHGHGAVYSLLVGSVAAGVLKQSLVPVVVVPDVKKAQVEDAKDAKE